MRFSYNLKINKQEFEIKKYHILEGNYYSNLLEKRNTLSLSIRKDFEILFKKANTIVWHILQIIEEPLKNSFDALKDNYLKNNNFIGEITVNIIINTRKKVISIIIKDNGAGINASDKSKKKNNQDFIGGDGIGIQLTKKRTNYLKLKRDYNGATIILKTKYDNS